MTSLPELVAAVRAAAPPPGMRTRIVAVDGAGGAGKSTLAERLAAELEGAPVVHTDDFASWDDPLDWWLRLRDDVLVPLSRGQGARFRKSDWSGSGREEWGEVAPAEFVVLEGVSASRDAFRPFLAYAIWVEAPRELRLARGLERDGESMRAQWEAWIAEEDAYVAAERPHERADAVVRGDVPL